MHTHTHEQKAVVHFRWCPANKGEFCLCQTVIYGTMAFIGFFGARTEYLLGKESNASGPVVDAWHLANDTGSDVLVFVMTIVVILFISKKETIKRVVAWGQVALLVAATSFVVYELYLKFTTQEEIKVGIMALAGTIGLVCNGIRLYILRIKRGEWDINRFIQDRHARGDLALSAGVILSAVPTKLFGGNWWDYAIILTILSVLVTLTIQGAHAAWKGELPNKGH